MISLPRKGKQLAATKANMHVTHQSRCDCIMHSPILLVEYVLTERFCQDPVEEYFGNQRKLGRRNDNPGVRSFGYHDNIIRMQRAVSCQSGNTRGRKDRQRAWVEITNDPLPVRKKLKYS